MKRKLLEINPNIKVEYIIADSSRLKESLDSIKDCLSNKIVTVLVNNVGVETGEPEPFIDKNDSNIDRIIDVNIRFSTYLTRTLLPTIQMNCKKLGCKGAIINLSSIAGVISPPLMSTYAGSKSYNQMFSISLAKECRAHYQGIIDVLSVRPTLVLSSL